MTIELTDLDPIPAELVPAAFTLVAVSGPGGPVRYKAQLGTGGQSLTFRGAWTAATAYAADDVLTNAGSSYVVTAAFTSGQTFSTVGPLLLAAKGDAGDTTDTTSIGGLDAATSAADTDLLHTL